MAGMSVAVKTSNSCKLPKAQEPTVRHYDVHFLSRAFEKHILHTIWISCGIFFHTLCCDVFTSRYTNVSCLKPFHISAHPLESFTPTGGDFAENGGDLAVDL